LNQSTTVPLASSPQASSSPKHYLPPRPHSLTPTPLTAKFGPALYPYKLGPACLPTQTFAKDGVLVSLRPATRASPHPNPNQTGGRCRFMGSLPIYPMVATKAPVARGASKNAATTFLSKRAVSRRCISRSWLIFTPWVLRAVLISYG